MLDPQFSQNERSSATVRQGILNDLRIAVQSGAIQRGFDDEQIVRWIKLNDVTEETLKSDIS
jgi:hypothetical protein